MAAVVGFLLGSALTVAASRYFGKKSEQSAETSSAGSGAAHSNATRGLVQSSYAVATTAQENVGFFSGMLRELWSYIRIAGSQTIRETIEPMFEDMSPKIRIKKIDMGSVPIRLDNIVVHKIKDGCVRMEVDVIWDGDCEIGLKADYIGSFGVQSLKLTGRMSVLYKPLTNELPIVGAVQYSFVNPPTLELDFTGLASVAEFKVLENKVKTTIADSLSGVVLPNRMMYKMDPALKLIDVFEQPHGIARITLVNGQGFIEEKRSLRSADVPDVYCNVRLGNSPVWKTSTVKNSLAPVWNESGDFLLSDNDQIIEIHAWDEDKGTLDSDDDLGTAKVSVGEVLLAGRTKKVELQQNHRGTGAFVTLQCDILELTTDTAGLQAVEKKRPVEVNSLYGLLTILVQGAYNLPLAKRDASTFVKATCGAKQFLTSVISDYPGVDALNPVYECAFVVPLSHDVVGKDVSFQLIKGVDTVIGTTVVTHESLLRASNNLVTEKRKVGDKGASLEFSVSLRGLSAASTPTTSPVAATAPSSPELSGVEAGGLGIVRVTAVKGRGFPVQKKRLKRNDVPDVYVNVRFGSSPTVWRTGTIKNNTDPEWNESMDYTLLHQSQIIQVDAFDEDKGTSDPDDDLGSGRVAVGKVLLAGGTLEVELLRSGKRTGGFVTLRCDMLN